MYVLEDLHTTQGLGALQFTSADPAFGVVVIAPAAGQCARARISPSLAGRRGGPPAAQQGRRAAAESVPRCGPRTARAARSRVAASESDT